jgi:hypothetical protein
MEPEEKPAKAKRKRKPTALGRSRVPSEIPPLMSPGDIITTLLPWLAYKPPPRRRDAGKKVCWRQQTRPPAHRPLRDAQGFEIHLAKHERPFGGSGARRRPTHEDSDLLFALLWGNHDLLPAAARDRIRDMPYGPAKWFELAKLYGLLRRTALKRLREHTAVFAAPAPLDTEGILDAGAFGLDFDELLRQVVEEGPPPDRWMSKEFWRCPTTLMYNGAVRFPCNATWWCPWCYSREVFKLYRALRFTAVHLSIVSHEVRSFDDYDRVREALMRDSKREERRTGRLPDELIWLRWWPLPESICDPSDLHDQLDVIRLTPGGDPLCIQNAEFVAAFAYPVGWLTVEDPRRTCYILQQTRGLRNRLVHGHFGEILYER